MKFKSRITISLQAFCLVAVAAVSMLPETALLYLRSRARPARLVACHLTLSRFDTVWADLRQRRLPRQKGQSMIEADAFHPVRAECPLITKVR